MKPTEPDFSPLTPLPDEKPGDETHAFDEIVGAFVHDTRSLAIAAEELVFRAQARVSEDRVKAYLAAVRESMARLSEMAASTFELMRWRGSKLPTSFDQTVDLAEIALTVCEMMREEFLDHQITLQLSSEPARLRADRTGLYRIVLNLLSNARRHAHPAAGSLHVLVCIEATADAVTLRVEDSGSGYPASMLRSASFHRLPWRRGQGLGLAIISQIVTLHGGSLALSNRSAGGARTLITFPVEPGREPGKESK